MSKSNQTALFQAHLEKKHGKGAIIKIKVEVSPSDVATGFFLNPSISNKRRLIYSSVLSFWRQDQVIDAGTVLINECFLAGDKRFKNPASMVHITACQELTNHVDFLSATTEII